MKFNNTTILTIVVIIAVGAAGFFGGMQYQKMQRQQQLGQFTGAGGQRRFGNGTGNGAGGRAIGQIISADDKSITVKLMDGSSKIVIISPSTTIMESTPSSKSALVNGKQVAVFGTPNSDGSITAQNISLNPQIRPTGQ